MITVNDKIKLFTKRVLETKQNEYDKKVLELEEKMVYELEDRKKNLVSEREKYEKMLLKGIKSEHVSRLSNARSEKKRRLLLKRKEMMDSLLDGVTEYTKEFVDTEEYENYLYKIIKTNIGIIKTMGEMTIHLRKEDSIKHQKKIETILLEENIKTSEFDFKIYEGRIIGGIIIMKLDKSSRIDMSLDSVIVDNREYMGQLIYELLEEAGEMNGK